VIADQLAAKQASLAIEYATLRWARHRARRGDLAEMSNLSSAARLSGLRPGDTFQYQ